MPRRCAWVAEDDPVYIRYHDEEWGVPLREDRALFELLCLEGAQAGLSWRTVLHRREGYRKAFSGFDPEVLARWGEPEVQRLLGDPSIIRNRLKIQSVIQNAKAYRRLRDDGTGFSDHLWKFTNGEPIVNRPASPSEVPAATPESVVLSRDLKKRGFSFVGPTVCYAFMQAAGLVWDHEAACFRSPDGPQTPLEGRLSSRLL